MNLPAWCFNCRSYITRPLRSPSRFLCFNCYEKLPVVNSPLCNHCGLEHLSSVCRESWARHIDSFHSLFYYRTPIHHWIINHKYSGGFFAGRLLRDFIQAWFSKNADTLRELDAVLPVPIHPLRLRHRGFNQTTFLLRSQRTLPVRSGWLVKKRHSSQQAGLTKKERRENIRGAFAVKVDIKGKHLLVFDDVCTTGQTIGEVCSCLKKAGAAQLHVLTLSRSM